MQSVSDLIPTIPDDFDDFWREAVDEAKQHPLRCHRSIRNDYDRPGFEVNSFTFESITGRTLNGWIAYPKGARRLPGFLWVPPYGRESVLPNEYGTREGYISLSLNFHGEGAFHREAYTPSRGYFSDGAESAENWIYRRMFQDAYIAARILQGQIEADESRLGVMGLSQGGGLAIWLGAHCPIFKAVCADMPFLAGIDHTLTQTVYRYPLKEVSDYMATIPLGEQRVRATLPYFDTINQATRCTVPTLVSLGLRDPACKPPNVRAVYDALAGERHLVTYDWGHDWHPLMVETNRNWLEMHLR